MMSLKRKYSSVPELTLYVQFSKLRPFGMYVFHEHFFYFPIFLYSPHSNNTRNFSVRNKLIFQVHNLIFTTILLSRFDKTLLFFVGLEFFNVVVGAKFSEQYLQNVTSGSVRSKQTKIDSK